MDAFGKFLKYFLAFFLGFFAVGAFQMHRQKQTVLYAQTFVIRHLRLVQTPSQIFLVLRVDGKDYWALDVDSNDACFLNEDSAGLSDETSASSSGVESSTAAFLAGAGGWTVKDILQSLVSTEREAHGFAKASGAVLGTIAGYRVGAWVIYRHTPPISQENIQNVLNDKTWYPTMKRLTWLLLWREIPEWDQSHHLDHRNLMGMRANLSAVEWANKGGRSTPAKARTIGADLNSADFGFLLRYRSPEAKIAPVNAPVNLSLRRTIPRPLSSYCR
jgi:hypothetical protein